MSFSTPTRNGHAALASALSSACSRPFWRTSAWAGFSLGSKLTDAAR